VCHSHLPAITPIVKQTCEEFGVPYVRHMSVLGAIWSVFRAVYASMGNPQSQKQQQQQKQPEESLTPAAARGVMKKLTGFLFAVWSTLYSLEIWNKPRLIFAAFLRHDRKILKKK